jgi:signal transduction histidine kinase
MFRSLKWRLTFYFLFVLLLTNLVLSIFFYARWKSNWKRGAHERLLGSARFHARLIASNFPQGFDPEKVTTFLRRGRRFPVEVVFFDAHGRILAHNNWEATPPVQPEVQRHLPEVLSGQVQDVYWASQTLAESQQHLLVPWKGPRNQGGAIYIRESFPTFRLQWRFWREIILAGVLISSLFGFLLSRSLSRPVQSMAAVAEALAAGDLSQRITYRSPDELGQLAEKFNLMADRIQELVDTLSEERDQLQEVLRQLQESERRRDELVANVSHELRTPLACIQGCVEALVDGVAATPDRQQECLSTITEELHYLSRLVNDLLNLARASLGQLDMEIQPCDLREVARQTMAKFQPQAERQGVALEITDPPDLPPAQADPGRIAQVLTNLLDNALRHTPPGGRIHLTLAGQGDHVFVTVEDTGTGIPREELPAVFERFYRADRSRNRETGGSGLGLAIVREIVHAHGGDVWIESELGQGTKIGFRLPLVPISTTS